MPLVQSKQKFKWQSSLGTKKDVKKKHLPTILNQNVNLKNKVRKSRPKITYIFKISNVNFCPESDRVSLVDFFHRHNYLQN